MIERIKNKISSIVRQTLINNNEWYQSQFRYCDKFWKRFPFNLEVVNLGSNTGLFGFRYEKTALRAANWALSPQSFNQDLAILKTYESYIGPRMDEVFHNITSRCQRTIFFREAGGCV